MDGSSLPFADVASGGASHAPRNGNTRAMDMTVHVSVDFMAFLR